MTDPSLAIQNAVETALLNHVSVKAAFGGQVRLYTLSAPVDAKYPQIIIGEDQVIGDDNECASGSEVTVTVHVYAREGTPAASRVKAKQIAGAVRAALTLQLPLDGHVMDDWKYETTRHLTDQDGLTAHSIVELTYLTTVAP